MYLVYVSRHGRFEQRQQNWRRGRLQIKGQRGKDASFTCAVLSRRATSPAPAQRKHCRYFSTLSRWGSLTSSKQKKMFFFCIMPASYWYVPRVIYVQEFQPTRSVSILTWGKVWSLSFVIEYPSLDSPGPSRTILSQLGVPACVLGFCLLGFVSIAVSYTHLTLPTKA